MKSITLVVAFVLSISCLSSLAQIADRKAIALLNVAPNLTNIISATVSIDSTTHIPNGTAYHNYFKATIRSVGMGTVNYKWVITNSGPQAAPLVIPGTMTLCGTGTDYIYIEKSSGRGPIFYKLSLLIESPIRLLSNAVGYN